MILSWSVNALLKLVLEEKGQPPYQLLLPFLFHVELEAPGVTSLECEDSY